MEKVITAVFLILIPRYLRGVPKQGSVGMFTFYLKKVLLIVTKI